jgi:hypothetical protein
MMEDVPRNKELVVIWYGMQQGSVLGVNINSMAQNAILIIKRKLKLW